MLKEAENVLVISAHADDETLGMGGTVFRLKEKGCRITWLIMSRVWTPKWSKEKKDSRERDIDKVADFVGYDEVIRWDFPDNRMDDFPRDAYQSDLIEVLNRITPDTIFCPGCWDWNWEHRIAFETVEVSIKPIYSPFIRGVYAYEVPSSTDWTYKSLRQFPSALYVGIEEFLDRKIEAAMLFSTEMAEFPHPRSPEGIRHYAAVRGMEVGMKAAESFAVLRKID
jgi:LmbE family N-acetylglucosaminyl deacetylase